MSKRVWAALAAVLAVGLVAGACGGGSSGSGTVTSSGSGAGGETEKPAFAEAEATTVVDVTLQDYAFVGLPATVQGPKVFFEATIKGAGPHELEIVSADGDDVAEIPSFESGKKTLAVELKPGTYTAQCLLKEGAKTHAQLGMKQDFTVTA